MREGGALLKQKYRICTGGCSHVIKVYHMRMAFIRKNITLILGMSIPVLMILFVAGSIYLPGLFIQPKFNFLYASGDDYVYYTNGQQYSVQNNKLVNNAIKQAENGNHNPFQRYGTYTPPRNEAKLFVYDVVKNESRQVSFDEAQNLNLDSNGVSPDGFEVVYGSRGDGIFPFFFYAGTDYNARYLKGHNVSKKLNVQSSGPYNYNFRFLGWIKN